MDTLKNTSPLIPNVIKFSLPSSLNSLKGTPAQSNFVRFAPFRVRGERGILNYFAQLNDITLTPLLQRSPFGQTCPEQSRRRGEEIYYDKSLSLGEGYWVRYILKAALLLILITITGKIYAQDKQQEAFNNSYALEYLGEYEQAAEAIKKGYDEKSYETNMRAGWLHYEAGLYIESQGYYKRAIALKPNSIEARLGYIYPLAALGNKNMVTDQYLKILQIDPLNTTANYRLGVIGYEKKDYKSAYNYFEKVINLYPFDYDSLIMYAWTNYQLGKGKEAKILFKKVLLLYPNNASALEGLSLIK